MSRIGLYEMETKGAWLYQKPEIRQLVELDEGGNH